MVCDATRFIKSSVLSVSDNLPAKGGMLLVCNHLSFADALLLIAATDRPIRFLMYKGIYEQRWMPKPFAKILRVIPIIFRATSA